MPQRKSLKKKRVYKKRPVKKSLKKRKPRKKSQKGGGDDVSEFLSAGIENMSLNNNEVNDLVKTMKKMNVTTKKGAMTAFQKILAARGKKGRKRLQNGGGKLNESDIKKFSKLVELEEYEGEFEDDYGLEIYDQLVEQGKAHDICRGKISKSYIYSAFNDKKGKGFLASIGGEYVGFIIYYMKNGSLYLDLVCAAKNKKTKGIPVGQLLISKMEQYAKKKKINTITAHAVTPALPFYLSTGWKTTGPSKDDKHPISKSMGIVKKVSPKSKPAPKKAVKKAPAKKKAKKKTGFFGSLKKMFGMKK